MDEAELCTKIVTETGEAVIVADRDGMIQFWNQGAMDIFGYSEQDALGESLDLIIPERFRDRHWEGFHTAIERGSSHYDRGDRLSVPAIRKDREWISVEFTVTMLTTESDDLVGIAAILRDVTDQWEQQQARTERIQELETQIEQIQDDQSD